MAGKLVKGLKAAVKRYPLAVALFFLSAVAFMVVVEINKGPSDIDDEIFVRIGLSLIYSAVLSLTLSSLFERFEPNKILKWTSHALTPAAGIAVYYLVIPYFDSAVPVIRFFLLCALTASLFFFFPFVKKGKSASYFAEKVFLRLAVTMIYYGIITGGVEAIIFAVENLLAVNVPNELYQHSAILIAGLFIPSFFFAGIPKQDEPEGQYTKLIKILLHYIAYILLTAYSTVLYIYFIKILIVFELPSNELGNLVIYYSLISIAVLYFGWHTKDENRWTKIFHKFYPYILIIPTLMMILSFWVRIKQYGFTEPRYYAILAAIFVLRSVSVIKLQKKVKLIPLVMSVLMLVSIFGPLSAFSVSKWSQNRRFERILTQADMLEDGKIIANPNAGNEAKKEITAIIDYFNSMHSTKQLNYINREFETDEMKDTFGFERFYGIFGEDREKSYYSRPYGEGIILISGYDYSADLHAGEYDIEYESGDHIIVLRSEDRNELMYVTLFYDGEEIYSTLMNDWIKNSLGHYSEESDEECIYTEETEDVSVKFILIFADLPANERLYYDVKILFTIK